MGGGLEREKKPSGVPGNAKNIAIGGHPAIHWESNPGSFSLLQNVTSYPALFLLFVLSVVMRWLSRTPPRARACFARHPRCAWSTPTRAWSATSASRTLASSTERVSSRALPWLMPRCPRRRLAGVPTPETPPQLASLPRAAVSRTSPPSSPPPPPPLPARSWSSGAWSWTSPRVRPRANPSAAGHPPPVGSSRPPAASAATSPREYSASPRPVSRPHC